MDTREHPLIDLDDFTGLCYDLLGMIRESGQVYDGILCPLKGGFYLSHFMSRHLGIPLFYIEISSYRGRTAGDFYIGQRPGSLKGRVLICDDIYDTGNTIKKIHEIFPAVDFHAACLVTKEKSAPAYYGLYVDKERWVDFFWEMI